MNGSHQTNCPQLLAFNYCGGNYLALLILAEDLSTRFSAPRLSFDSTHGCTFTNKTWLMKVTHNRSHSNIMSVLISTCWAPAGWEQLIGCKQVIRLELRRNRINPFFCRSDSPKWVWMPRGSQSERRRRGRRQGHAHSQSGSVIFPSIPIKLILILSVSIDPGQSGGWFWVNFFFFLNWIKVDFIYFFKSFLLLALKEKIFSL